MFLNKKLQHKQIKIKNEYFIVILRMIENNSFMLNNNKIITDFYKCDWNLRTVNNSNFYLNFSAQKQFNNKKKQDYFITGIKIQSHFCVVLKIFNSDVYKELTRETGFCINLKKFNILAENLAKKFIILNFFEKLEKNTKK